MSCQNFKTLLYLLPIYFGLFLNIPDVNAQTACTTTVKPGQSIQQAINSSPGNQTICVEYGTYKEKLDITKAGLKLIGIPNSSGQLPIIDGEYNKPSGNNALPGKCPGIIDGKPCYLLDYGKLVRIGASNVNFENFDVTRSSGVGIGAYNDSGPISNIVIKNNRVHESRSTGIEILEKVSNVRIEQNDVYRSGNFAPFNRSPFTLDWPGGVAAKGVNTAYFIKNKIHENWGEGLIMDANTGGSQNITVLSNHIYDNYAVQIYLHAVKNVHLENNFIYHSLNPEFFRGGKACHCIAITSSEPQYPQIQTNNITMKNNVLTGCSVNYAIWGGVMSNLSFSGSTLYTVSGSGYLNYSTLAGTNYTSTNNISIGAVGTNPLGGDTNYPSLAAAGTQATTITLARNMSPKGFKLTNYTGKGANVDLIPDVNQVGSQATPSPTVTPTPTATPSPTPTNTPTPTLTITPSPTKTPTTTQTPIAKLGDANKDGNVNVLDYTILANTFGSTTDLRANFNNDSVINILDYQILVNNFGK